MKRTKFFFTLLVAVVMMAMSPMKMWADNWQIYVNDHAIDINGSIKLHLEQGDEFYIREDSYGGDLYPESSDFTFCEEIYFATYYNNNVITVQETGDYIVELCNPTVHYTTNLEQIGFSQETGEPIFTENKEYESASAIVKIHKLTHHDAAPGPDCQTAGTIEYWSCDKCQIKWDNKGNIVDDLSYYSGHDYVNGECSVCHAKHPYSSIITGFIPELTSNSTYPWVVSTDDGFMPGFMSDNVGVDNSSSETTLTFVSTDETILSFDYAVSSESPFDKLTITVDGNTVVNGISGDMHDKYSATLQAGNHTLTLSYSKDSSDRNGNDRGYIYNIIICDHSGNTHEIVNVPANCVLGSHKESDCTVCGLHYVSNVQNDKIDHNYVNGVCTGCHGEPANMDASSFVDGTAYARTSSANVTTLTYTRTITDSQVGKWQALYVPFRIPVSELSSDFDVATIQNFHEYTDENGAVKDVTLEVRYVKSGTLKANHPYLIRPKSAGEKQIELNNAVLAEAKNVSIDCRSVERSYTFTGIYQPMQNLRTNDYLFLAGGSLTKAEDDATELKAQRWYLAITDRDGQVDDAPTASQAKSIGIFVIEDDAPTGIEDLHVVTTPISAQTSAAIYDLQGRRQQSAVRGVNIVRQADGSFRKIMNK